MHGYCPIHIKGCRAAVETAVNLVVHRFGGLVDGPPQPSDTSNVLQLQPVANGLKLPVEEQQTLTQFDLWMRKNSSAEVFSDSASTHECNRSGTSSDVPELVVASDTATQAPCPLTSDSNDPPASAQSSEMAPASLVAVLQKHKNASDTATQAPCPLNLEQSGGSDSNDPPASAQNSEMAPASLIAVLQKHKNALKSSATVSSFHKWLQSVDIESLDDFYDALTDDEVFEEMKQHGFKAFKRSAVLHEVEAQLKVVQQKPISISNSADRTAASSNIMPCPQPQAELICPIM